MHNGHSNIGQWSLAVDLVGTVDYSPATPTIKSRKDLIKTVTLT